MARIGWCILLLVIVFLYVSQAAPPPPPEVEAENRDDRAPVAAPPIDWREVAERGVFGKLGHPLGATLKIEGVAADGDYTRMKRHAGETLLRIQRVNDVALNAEVIFVFNPFRKDAVVPPNAGERFKYVGYETGGFEGITLPRWEHMGPHAGTAWAFEMSFIVMNEFEEPHISIADIPSRSLGNQVHLRLATIDEDDPFLAELYAFTIERFPEGSWLNFGPDSSYREIIFFSRGRKIQLQSWHPVFETNPKLVAGSGGITSLGTQTREEFLQQDDQVYVAKRNAFDEIELRLRKHYPR